MHERNRGILLAALAVFCTVLTSGCPDAECNGTPWLPKLAAPIQTAPDNGAVFDNFPRDTTLVWDALEGAVEYDIEIDCFLCCSLTEWCTDLGEPAQTAYGVLTNQYDFTWIGAQPGRWRVRGVRENGQAGEWSDWSEFEYTV